MKLLLTLGHNSSAILVDKTHVLCGYEEERLSKVKADSSYPKLAIEEILKHHPEAKYEVTEVCISHWFNSLWKFEESKYFNPQHLKTRFKKAEWRTISKNFTHHDAHAHSVWNFSRTMSGLTMVADGFGTDCETVSIYEDGKLVDRMYFLSIGLWYQYATAYLGMKENQDEYKLLGMEAHVLDEHREAMDKHVEDIVDFYYDNFDNHTDQVYSQQCAQNRQIVNHMLDKYCAEVAYDQYAVAYLVQAVTEKLVLRLLEDYKKPEHRVMQFSGGVFYNVKLNNVILNKYAEEVSVIEFHPLAGDQGCGLGFVDVKYDNLFWGKRFTNKYDRLMEVNGVEMTFVMRGSMEFGPRALGNTSTIAAPTQRATEVINMLNGRPNVMPMAPMLRHDVAAKYCRNINKLGFCKHFMIVATDWLGPIEGYEGVIHKKPGQEVYTCRPQVVDNEFTKKYGVCINTSLNAHGQPILFDYHDYEEMTRIHYEQRKLHSDS